MKKLLYIIIIIFLILSGCATQKTVIVQKVRHIEIPPGLDSTTVLLADSIFSEVAVTEETEKEAKLTYEYAQKIWALGDSLWQSSQLDTLTHEDSTKIPIQVSDAKKMMQHDKEQLKYMRKLEKKLGLLNSEFIATISKHVMIKAIARYEQAIQKNKFDISFYLKLVQNLQTISERLKDKNYLRRAATEMEKVVAQVKDNHRFYYQLGKINFDLIDWRQSYKYTELATKTIRSTALFNITSPELYFMKPDSVPLDTSLLVTYLYQQALCKTRLYEDKPALALFREAQQITPLETYKKTFQEWIEWILWDDGNIRASELRDSADSLRGDKIYLNAKIAYLNLLPVLRTSRTFDQINWRIAVIDYSSLDNKIDGLNRMQDVIKRSVTDSLTGAPVDTAYQVYFNTYGTMCYNTGVENLTKDLTTAYIYFTQASENYYNERGKAYLQLAVLSEYDARETIKLCEKANTYFDLFDDNEKKLLYRLFYNSYRKLGEFTASKAWFDRWQAL